MKSNPRKTRPSGFALIVTLSLMILLTVIAIGLLSLATVSIRSTGQGLAASTARNNARLAMLIALGELQKTMGPDTAASATAESLTTSKAKQPHLLGTWGTTDPEDRNWHWEPSATGNPNYSDRKNKFTGWLVSSADTIKGASELAFGENAMPNGANSVMLVKPLKNLPANAVSPEVSVEKVRLNSSTSQKGKYGWAVFDESQKASIDIGDPDEKTGMNVASRNAPANLESATRSAPYRFRADALGGEFKDQLKNPQNLASLGTAALLDNSNGAELYKGKIHDFTIGSLGLLTDSARGGLKTDLTTFFENNERNTFSNEFPTDTPYTRRGTNTFTSSRGAPTWRYLWDHYSKYKRLQSTTNAYTVSASDLAINRPGFYVTPDQERLIPIIAKLQIVFSMVSHGPSIDARRTEQDRIYGAGNYGIPNVVYEPIVTLYNPYDVDLNLSKLRIRVWDIPVGFRLSKVVSNNVIPFRNDRIPTDKFFGISQMNAGNQDDQTARKCFTLLLVGGPNETPKQLTLRPGEVKIFSQELQPNWTWESERNNSNNARVFDYRPTVVDLTNSDAYYPSTANGNSPDLGVRTIPGLFYGGGFQTDHLANSNPALTYSPGDGNGGGVVVIRKADSVKFEVKPKNIRQGDVNFQVDILAGAKKGDPVTVTALSSLNQNSKNPGEEDLLRSYKFKIDNPEEQLIAPGDPIIISRQKTIGDIFQLDTATRSVPGGKTAFASLEMTARTTKDSPDAKPWLFNNPIAEGLNINSTTIGFANQAYDLRLREVQGIGTAVEIQGSGATSRGYFGASSGATYGSTFAPMMHIPTSPAVSLGDLIHSNLVSGSGHPHVMHPLGNSHANPLIASNKVSEDNGSLMDHSYLMNDALWDSYYFSTITGYEASFANKRKQKDVLADLYQGKFALNSRITSIGSVSDPDAKAGEILRGSPKATSKNLTKNLAIRGPFNVNSTSVDAWTSVLASLRGRTIKGTSILNFSEKSYDNNDATPFARYNRPLSDSRASTSSGSGLTWAGFRSLKDNEIITLAQNIVNEIKEKGASDQAPYFSVGEFVNRRPGSNVHEHKGAIQTAIDGRRPNDRSIFNKDAINLDSSASPVVVDTSKRNKGANNTETMQGYSSAGAPGMITQGDIMKVLAPIATTRGDTFKIRSYGEATAADGVTVLASAWCEAVVQRVPEFVNQGDTPEIEIDELKDENKTFGRRFNIISFRWLSKNEL